MDALKVLVVSGSSRTGSFNRQLAAILAKLARAAGHDVTELDLRALALPLYDADIERVALPEGAATLRRLFAAHDVLLLSSPEYNAFPTPLLINALDWTSRVPAGDDLPNGIAAMAGTVVGLVSASPGALGGLRSLMFIRQMLTYNLGMLIVPEQFALSAAAKAFHADGTLVDPKHEESVQRVVHAALRTGLAMKQR
ncbi:MAG: NAD(P)H-dependent oxidoreductase [Proteobacteria bacterium]|nr:NAD(P)H-dependent oxidoreductase [Pseudomonadota bacterium]